MIVWIFFTALTLTLVALVNSHNESGKWSCESHDSSTDHLVAKFEPATITLDGRADDWNGVDGSEFPLLPALDPHEDDAYKGGKMTVKTLHDGKDVFFLLQVDGDYAFSADKDNKCPSVALMFQIGEKATYHNMGGCKDMPGSCTNKSCRGHEVDLMHFSMGKTIPGRLYGGNPLDVGYGGDRFGHLVDVYAWNPHCRYIDGLGPSGNDTSAHNDWKGAWWHSSLNNHSAYVKDDSPYSSEGTKGTYYFEFSRPLRTMDHLQQDAQFKIGESANFSAAFWYPVDGKPWSNSGHFSTGCDWLSLSIVSGGGSDDGISTSVSSLDRQQQALSQKSSSWDAAVAFSLLLSLVAFCSSVFIGFRMFRNPGVSFTRL